MPKAHFPRRLIIVLLASLSIFMVACYPSHKQSTFGAAGPVAERQEDLFMFILWLGVAVFVLVGGAMIYAIIRFRRRPGQGIPPQTHGNTKLEIAWTIAPAIVLIVIAVPTITGIFYLADPPSGEDPLLIRVTGHQWWWEFEYPELTFTDERGQEQALVTANEMHIPVGRTVSLDLKSADVIHSFWIPKLAGKQDMIPNNTRIMWLKADEAGTYYGQCAELCGLSHALMRLRTIAQPQDEFDAWVLDQQRPAVEPVGDAARGEAVFMVPIRETSEGVVQGCMSCHTVRGTVATGKIGPDLTHVASRDTIAAGVFDRNVPNLVTWLEDPPGVKPGSIMPNLELTGEEISALVAYLQSLK